ncbi:MAG TPA: hypothetical protein VIH31_00460 [Candidatus Paceibacterota bacterium]
MRHDSVESDGRGMISQNHMQKFLEKLRSKPEHIRKNILYIATFSITGIIVIIWIYSLANHFSAPETKEAFRNDLKPLTVIKDNLTDTYQSISADLSKIKNK